MLKQISVLIFLYNFLLYKCVNSAPNQLLQTEELAPTKRNVTSENNRYKRRTYNYNWRITCPGGLMPDAHGRCPDVPWSQNGVRKYMQQFQHMAQYNRGPVPGRRQNEQLPPMQQFIGQQSYNFPGHALYSKSRFLPQRPPVGSALGMDVDYRYYSGTPTPPDQSKPPRTLSLDDLAKLCQERNGNQNGTGNGDGIGNGNKNGTGNGHGHGNGNKNGTGNGNGFGDADGKKKPGQDATSWINNINFTKVIIDTDGTSDDAMGILLALGATKMDIIAITTTSGTVNLRTATVNVIRTLEALKPENLLKTVHQGSENPITLKQRVTSIYGADGFGEVKFDTKLQHKPHSEHAVSALIRLVHRSPGQISIICLGPLTNIALAMRLDTKFKKAVKHIIWVGGSVSGIGNVKPAIEFNSFYDPVAGYVVFNETDGTDLKPIIMIPWELSAVMTKLEKKWRRNILGSQNRMSKQIKFLNKIEQKLLDQENPDYIAADAKAIAIAMNPHLVKEAHFYHLDVVFEGHNTRGLTLVDHDGKLNPIVNVAIVEDLDLEEFKRMLIFELTQDKHEPSTKPLQRAFDYW